MPKSRSQRENERAALENRPLKDQGTFKPTGFHVPLAMKTGRSAPGLGDKPHGSPHPFRSDESIREVGFELFTRGVEAADKAMSKTLKFIGRETFDNASKRIKAKEATQARSGNVNQNVLLKKVEGNKKK